MIAKLHARVKTHKLLRDLGSFLKTNPQKYKSISFLIPRLSIVGGAVEKKKIKASQLHKKFNPKYIKGTCFITINKGWRNV